MPATTATKPQSRRARKAVGPSIEVEVRSFPTDLGWIALAAAGGKVLELKFGYASASAAECALEASLAEAGQSRSTAKAASGPLDIEQLVDRLQRFASGEPVDFADVPIDESYLTPFGKRIVAACRKIGWGGSSSYGQLAKACRRSGAARAVGSVMAKNRAPLIVPCHRVLGAGGKLGGYSAPGGLATKRRLLALENPAQ